MAQQESLTTKQKRPRRPPLVWFNGVAYKPARAAFGEPRQEHRLGLGNGRLSKQPSIRLDETSRVAEWRRLPIIFTRIEFRIMATLVRAHGDWVPSEKLLLEVWGFVPGAKASELIRAHIANIRRKMYGKGWPDRLLQTRRGAWYRLSRPPPD